MRTPVWLWRWRRLPARTSGPGGVYRALGRLAGLAAGLHPPGPVAARRTLAGPALLAPARLPMVQRGPGLAGGVRAGAVGRGVRSGGEPAGALQFRRPVPSAKRRVVVAPA